MEEKNDNSAPPRRKKYKSDRQKMREEFIRVCNEKYFPSIWDNDEPKTLHRDWDDLPWGWFDDWMCEALYQEGRRAMRGRKFNLFTLMIADAGWKSLRDIYNERGAFLSIVKSEFGEAARALQSNPSTINSIHKQSGWNPVMLATQGHFAKFIDIAMDAAGSQLDFTHRSATGKDLMEIALETEDNETIMAVQRAYERFAPHLIEVPPITAQFPEFE